MLLFLNQFIINPFVFLEICCLYSLNLSATKQFPALILIKTCNCSSLQQKTVRQLVVCFLYKSWNSCVKSSPSNFHHYSPEVPTRGLLSRNTKKGNWFIFPRVCGSQLKHHLSLVLLKIYFISKLHLQNNSSPIYRYWLIQKQNFLSTNVSQEKLIYCQPIYQFREKSDW